MCVWLTSASLKLIAGGKILDYFISHYTHLILTYVVHMPKIDNYWADMGACKPIIVVDKKHFVCHYLMYFYVMCDTAE